MRRTLGALIVGLLLPLSASSGERAAAAFTLKDTFGKKFDLAPHLGKDVVLLNFFATWCAPCMAELPSLQALQDRYGEQGLKVVVVSIDDPKSAAKVKPLIRELKLSLTVLLDTETRVVSLYNAKKSVPFTIMIGRDGNVAAEHMGFQPGDDQRLATEIEGLLGVGATPEDPEPAP